MKRGANKASRAWPGHAGVLRTGAAAGLLGLASLAGPPAATWSVGAGAVAAQETRPLEDARLLLQAQMPVSAAALLARELSSGGVEGDEAVLLTARAFAEQRSWSSARRLLAGRDFVDPGTRAQATLLLARAYSGLDSAVRAAEHYRAYLGAVDSTPSLAVRVGFADVLDRLDRGADAEAELRLAAAEHPDLARWIRLERLYVLAAAGDSSAFALADSIVQASQVPSDSALLPAARLAFRVDDPARGTALARRSGEGVWNALAARQIGPHLLAIGDSAGAAAAFRDAIAAGSYTSGTGPALLALDSSWRALRDVGRSDTRVGRNERAVRYLTAALALSPESEKPEIAEMLAGAYVALGDPNRAVQLLGPWIGGREASPGRLASLWLLAARIFTSLGETVAADEAYEMAARGDGNSGALAAYLIADAHQDADRPGEAAVAFERAFRRFPGSSYGSRSLERLALLAFHEARYDDARGYLDEYRRRYPRGGWYQGAIYWTGKTEDARGDTAAADAFYLETFGHDPLNYYAILASRRISRDRWEALRLRDPEPTPELDAIYAAAIDRMNRLRDIGWVSRARREYREVRDRGSSDPGQTLAFAHALNAFGWTQEGIREGWRAKSRRARWSRSLLEAIYPLPFREVLIAAARRRDLSPHFVAGLSRRESMFDPEIMSAANAVGLMQLLPETARDVSSRAGLPEYRRSQLTVPEVNLLLGTQYLADVLGRFDGFPIAGMISYNAGPHRYGRWREFPEFDDEEQLVERIPFRETREYVRAVTELSEIYRFLYPDLEPLTP